MGMVTLETSSTDDIAKELDKLLNQFRTDKTILVGIQDDAGLHEGGIGNATLGAVLHFGTDNGHIPPRPWLDEGIESGDKEYVQIISDGIESGQDIDTILEQIGVTAVAYVQNYMTDLAEPANAESTVKKKGSSNPLIDTSALKQAITHLVTSEDITEGI